MSIKIKRIGLFLTLMVVVTAGGALLWPARQVQFVTLPDGTQCYFAGANWGTAHSQPRFIARVIDHLPGPVAGLLRRVLKSSLGDLGSVGTTEPTWCFWFKRVGAVRPATGRTAVLAKIQLADENGIVGGESGFLVDFGGNYAMTFPSLVPRRSRFLEIRFFSDAKAPAPPERFATVRIPNPAFGQFPQWQPEPLPATRQIGDSSVSVTQLSVGTGSGRRGPRMGGLPQPTTDVSVESRPATGSRESWIIQSFELSDATGNRLRSSRFFGSRGPQYSLPGTFWPGENAWRLKLTMKREGGYPASDLLTFTNLPVPVPGASNGVVISNQIHGATIVLRNYISNTNISPGPYLGPYYIELQRQDPQADYVMDYIQTVTDAGQQVPSDGTLGDTDDSLINFDSLPKNARYLNVTVAVQKPVPVEFLLKPPASTDSTP